MSPRTPLRPTRRSAVATGAAGAVTPLSPLALPGPARVLWFALAGSLAVRIVAPLLPGRGAWGVDLLRDLPRGALLPWAACALALVPAVSAPFAARLPRSARSATLLAVAFATLLALLAWSFPEGAFLTGDTALRHGGFTESLHPELVVPQALPADLVLHYRLPRWLHAHTPLDAEHTGRLWDAGLAFASAWAAWSLARAVAKSGAAALAAASAAAFTAALTLFNGYAKSIVELNVLALVAAGALLALARGGRGLARLGLAVGLALVLHRAALALLPAWLAGLAVAAGREPGAWRRPASWLALAPLAGLALAGPQALHTLTTFDAAHHLSGTATSGGSWAAATFSAFHLADVLQVILLTTPLALPLLALLATRAAPWRRVEMLVLGAFALPQLAMLLLVHPQQGLFRDWDVFVTAGIALSATVAWLIAEAIDAAAGGAWLAIPVALFAAVPATQWLTHQSDAPRALARAEAILTGPPERPYAERAQGFDHIGVVRFNRGDFRGAAAAYERSIAAAPNPRLYVQWGMAETLAKHPDEALRHYLEAARLNPDMAIAWRGVAASSSEIGDVEHLREAATQLQRLAPDDPMVREALEYLRVNGGTRVGR